MKYLLDTNTAIWALGDKAKLSNTAKEIIGNTSLSLFVSVVSAWEIAIKVSLGKLDFAGGSSAFLDKMQKNGLALLNIESAHLEIVEALPFIHRDPFDRLLVATAQAEGMTILTADANIRKYAVPSVW